MAGLSLHIQAEFRDETLFLVLADVSKYVKTTNYF